MAETPEHSSKTEKPTARRLEDARQKGNVPLSRDVTAVLMLGSLTALLAGLGAPIMQGLAERLASVFQLSQVEQTETVGGVASFAANYTGHALLWMLPIFGVLLVAAVLSYFLQGGLVIASERVRPQWQRISPMAGLKRMYSVTALVELLKGTLKIILILTIGMSAIGPLASDLNNLFSPDARGLASATGEVVIQLLTYVCAGMLVVGLMDFGWQRFTWWRRLFMTREEIREEFRQGEGNPEVKARIKALRRQRASRRMMAAVPEATVIITNPTHFAVALKYDRSVMRAPRCVAKGQDIVALRIREVAGASGVPIVENRPLARALFAAIEVDDEVPPQHYKAVAEIISYVMSMRRTSV